MTLNGFDSPIQVILGQSDVLGFTSEQRRSLELLDIDFRSEIVRLSSERQLLELDAQRTKAASRSGHGLTAESLAAIDAITAKIRQTWLHAREQARAALSVDQLAKLSEGPTKLPGVDSVVAPPDSTELRAWVTEAVAARIKDAKVVEIETAQAIAERLFGWAKSAAIVAGVPLALLVGVLGVLGIGNWADFKQRIVEGKKEVELQLATARQSAKEFGDQATALQAQYAELKKQFGDVSTLANDVRGLTDKVQRLEQIQFEKSSELLPETQATVEQQIKDYRAYLQSLGYHPPATVLKVVVDPNWPTNTYFDGERLVVGPKLVTMPDVIYHSYTLRMLKEVKPESWDASWKITVIMYGLADYFTCSYIGDPKFGAKYVQTFPEVLSPEHRKLGYLRNIANNRPFVTDSAAKLEREEHTAGEVWGGVFWDVRVILGCKPDSAKCGKADKILLLSWTALNLDPHATVDVRFAQNIFQNVHQSVSADLAGKVRDAFARRGLSLPRH